MKGLKGYLTFALGVLGTGSFLQLLYPGRVSSVEQGIAMFILMNSVGSLLLLFYDRIGERR